MSTWPFFRMMAPALAQEFDPFLANAFVCTANIEADDPAVVVDGNRKVLAARLSRSDFGSCDNLWRDRSCDIGSRHELRR